MEVAAGETGLRLDERAHTLRLRYVPQTPEAASSRVPDYTSDPRADHLMLQAVKRWEPLSQGAFWDALTLLLLENAGRPGDYPQDAPGALSLMGYYLPGDFTRAVLRLS